VEIIIWGPLVRMAQVAIAASPTLVVGWIVAAVFERILGRDGTYKLFGGGSWRQLLNAWLLGMLLPVCSLGVIPIMVQMRRSGIAGGTILAFGLTAPLFNPISVLYGLTLSDPIALFVFCIASLTIVTVMGLLWDWIYPLNQIPNEPLPPTPYGWRRIGAVALSVCQNAFSASSLYILIAIAGVGLLSMILPAGILQKAAGKDDMLAPVTMAAVATLAYVTPMVAIVQIASMFQHGNSIGAAFTLLVLGTGVNLGMLSWTVANYRLRPTLVWLACLLVIVLAIGYGVDQPLRPKGVEPADHTHAFDIYCNPFNFGTTGAASASIQLIQDSLKAEELIAGAAAMLFLFGGFLNWRFDPNNRLMNSLIHVPINIATSGEDVRGFGLHRDIVLPKSVIAISCLGGLVASSVVACFLYYPPRSDIREEMNAIQAELTGDSSKYAWDKIMYWIPIQEDWAHKLAVSSYLRGQPLTRFQKVRMQVFLNKLELLEHSAEDQDKSEVDDWKTQSNIAFLRFKSALDESDWNRTSPQN
jgi:uncharacterized membrane protein YraQ (UPF0718 family)